MNLYQLTLFGAVLLGSATLSAQSTYCSKLPVKPGKGVTVTGVVECDGKPVAGVKVSDGYEITKTDKKGAYYLKSKKQNPQVFITIPSGYEASREDAVPQFWADFTEPADKLERHDFKLNKVNQDKHAIIAITDVHLANQRNDVSIFSGPYLDVIREDVKSFNDQGIPVYTLNMGDSSWDIYWYAHNYTIGDFRNTLKEANYPTPMFTVMGNHDNDPATPEGPDAGRDVGEAVVEAGHEVVVVGTVFAGLGGIEDCAAAGLGVGADESASARSGNHLVAVERQDAEASERRAFAAFVAGAESLGGIFHHGYVIFFGHGEQLVYHGGHTVEVDYDDGLGLASGGGDALVDGAAQQRGRHVPGRGLGVDKHGARSLI